MSIRGSVDTLLLWKASPGAKRSRTSDLSDSGVCTFLRSHSAMYQHNVLPWRVRGPQPTSSKCTLQPSLPRTFSMFTIHYSTFHSIKYNPMVWENDCIVLYSSGASERPLKKKTSHILRFIVPDQMMWKSQAVRRFFLSCLPSGLEKKTRWRGISSVISQHCTKKPHDSLVKLLDNRHQTPGVDGDNDRS